MPSSGGDSSALYASQLPQERTSVRIQEGTGIYSAMNQGLQESAGDYVVFLNAGDLLAGEATLAVVDRALAGATKQWAVFGGFVVRDQEISEIRPTPNPTAWLVGVGRANVMHPSVYYRRAFLEELGGYDESFRIAGDLELNIRAINTTSPLVVDSLTSVFFANGISSTSVQMSIKEALRARLKSLDSGVWTGLASLNWYFYQVVRAVLARVLHPIISKERARTPEVF